MGKRALVLSGGGPVGIAWESGLIGGYAAGGVDLSQADFIVGTSAGSFVGARLAMGMNPEALVAPFLAMDEAAPPPLPSGAGDARPQGEGPPNTALLMRRLMDARRRPAAANAGHAQGKAAAAALKAFWDG